MKRRVVVTGMGAVTSLGCKVEPLWADILAGKSGVHELKYFDTTGHKVKFGGDIYGWDDGLYEGYIDKKESKRVDRFCQFAIVAGIDAVRRFGPRLHQGRNHALRRGARLRHRRADRN